MMKIPSCEIAEVVAGLCKRERFKEAAIYLNIVTAFNQNDRRIATAAWETLPKGWTEESLRKFWESLTGDVKHKMTKCVEKIKDVPGIDDPYAFCASLKDKMLGTTYWRKGRRKGSRKKKKK